MKEGYGHEYKLRIRGDNVRKYQEMIGFTLSRKTIELEKIISTKKRKPELLFENNRLLRIRDLEIVEANDEYVYSLDVDIHHTVLINENIVTHQCDGDEDGLLLLLEYLLNFSKYYLPSSLGGKMDAPLVLSVVLDPKEVDGESHNIDTLAEYPLKFYQDALEYPKPVKLESYMRVAKNYLGTEGQYEGFMYTHPTENINWGPKKSAYSELGSMSEKIDSQLFLTEAINAVNKQDVARKILQSHFTPDMMGNMRSFSTQSFRCIKCGEKFRRVPLSGKCNECEGKIVLTVTRGMISKYLPKAKALCERFDLGSYTAQRMELITQYITSLTDNPKVKQSKLSSFFS
jgi:DNA polymerase II large subunit